MAESETPSQLSRRLSDSASSWPSQRCHCSRLQDFPTWFRYGRIEDIIATDSNGLDHWLIQNFNFTVAESKTLLHALFVMPKSEMLLRPSRRFSDSASSWPNQRRHRGRLQDFLNCVHYGRIEKLTTGESTSILLTFIITKSDTSSRQTPIFFDSASSLTGSKLLLHHGLIRGVTIAELKTLQLAFVMDELETPQQLSRRLSMSTSSWLNRRPNFS